MGIVYTLGHSNLRDSGDQTPRGVSPSTTTLVEGVWMRRKSMIASILHLRSHQRSNFQGTAPECSGHMVPNTEIMSQCRCSGRNDADMCMNPGCRNHNLRKGRTPSLGGRCSQGSILPASLHCKYRGRTAHRYV